MKRMLCRMSIVILMLVVSKLSFAQKTVSGVVNDKNGAPVSGVSVVVKGTTKGTTTDAAGKFSIAVPAGSTTLVFSSVGYKSQELNISSVESATVSLEETNASLNEVVVVGYGSGLKKKDLTGSVASVSAKDFNKGVATSPDQLIQGKVPGVQILANNGAPGAGSTIRIRGTNSIRSGNDPLWVIDGVPLDYTSVESGFGSAVGNTPGVNPLNYINPADIATMDILKDATAAAIYGSRGANGVILITTKRAQSGQPSLDVNSFIGTASVMKKIDILSGDEYRAALTKYGITSGNYGSSVDAMDEILRNALIQNYSVGLGGGNENARFRFSTAYQNEEGIVQKTGYKKITGNLTSSFKFLDSKKLGVDVRLMAAHTIDQLGPVTNDAGFQQSVIGTALQWNPTHPLRKPNDSIWIVDPALGATTINPLAMLEAWNVQGNTTSILGNLQPYYKFNDHFEYRFLYGVIQEEGITRGQIAKWLNQQNIENRGIAGYFTRILTAQQVTHTLTYNGDVTPNINLNAVAGYEYRKTDIRGNGMSGQDFDENGIPYYYQMQAATVNSRSIYSYADPIEYLQSFFGRVNFNYKNKYYLTGTVRVDGSSKFGENHKYGTFPSFGAAWTISNEDFMKGSTLFNYLKFRVGYGITGNQEFPGGASLAAANITGPGSTQLANYDNPDLRWEKVASANAAIDFNILDSRLNGSIEYYNKITSDPLFLVTVPQPGPTGAKYWTNLTGEVHNSGVEVSLNANIIRQTDFNWNLGVNVAFQQNELKDLVGVYETGALHGQGISGATSQRMANNQPLDVFYLRVWEGIDKSTGQSVYKDDGYTKYYVGDPNPNMLLGITTDLSYKKLYLVINMHGAFGHQLYNNTANSVLPIGNLGTRNISAEILKLPNQEDVSDPIAPSTRYMEKGDYLKLGNATLSYRLGTVGKVFKNSYVYITGQNLFVITDFTGFDPEVNVDKSVDGIPSYGIEYTPYPTARKIIFGISFSL
jgi:iron complex outermembrane receptor protein